MTSESIPSYCKDCPQARENAYTGSWYCVVSGAPLGSKRADECCTMPGRRIAAAGSAARANAGQASGSEPGPTSGPAPAANPAQEAPITDASAPRQEEAKAGSDASKPTSSDGAAQEEFVYGYPFDVM